MKPIFKKSIPVLILLFAAAAYAAMQLSATKPQTNPTKSAVVSAEYIQAQSRPVSYTVNTQGTVQPCTQTMLTGQVAGKISWVAAGFHTGGVFSKGDPMIEIESHDYRDAVIQAKAELARVQLNLAKERALAAQAKKDWKALGLGVATNLVLRRPQMTQAMADVQAARAAVGKAERDLAKTRILAPYALMIRSKEAEINQNITPGTPLAQIFAVDSAQVRLPVTDEELSHLDVSVQKPGVGQLHPAPTVILTATVSSQKHVWQGSIVRTEGIYDPNTRVTYVIAQVDDPYGFNSDTPRQPLAIGMFVEAQIQGKKVFNKIVVPPQALIDSEALWVIRDDNTLEQRDITVLYADADHTVIGQGVTAGERICLNTIDYAANGLAVEPVPARVNPLAYRGGEK